MSKVKTTLSKNELIRTLGTLRNQVVGWKHAFIQTAAHLLLENPNNELFKDTSDYLADNTVKQIISFAAEVIDNQRTEHPDNVIFQERYKFYEKFRTLQLEFKSMQSKEQIKSPKYAELMDELDREIEVLFTAIRETK